MYIILSSLFHSERYLWMSRSSYDFWIKVFLMFIVFDVCINVFIWWLCCMVHTLMCVDSLDVIFCFQWFGTACFMLKNCEPLFLVFNFWRISDWSIFPWLCNMSSMYNIKLMKGKAMFESTQCVKVETFLIFDVFVVP